MRMRRLLKILSVLLLFPLLVSASEKFDEKKLSSQQFLSLVRNPPGRSSWSIMEGTATHRRASARTVKAPLRLSILFTKTRILAQIDFNNGEIYNIGQALGKNTNVSVEKAFPADRKPELPVYGILPQDLALTFLYWTLEKEEPRETFRMQECRVFLLREHAPASSCVKVWISAEYFFPVKAEWYSIVSGKAAKDPYKMLEVVSFVKKDSFWYPGKLRLEGKDGKNGEWKTIVAFDKLDADATVKRLPQEIFRGSKTE